MKNIFNTLGGALAGKSLSDKIQSTLGSVAGGSASGPATGAGIPGAGDNASLGNLDLKNLNLGTMLGSAAVGGLLGALFTGKSTAKIAKGALMVGGTAAAGALAWKFYQKWSQPKANPETSFENKPHGAARSVQTSAPMANSAAPENLQTQALAPAENTALLLLEAMVFAARADGHIDEEEQKHIQNTVTALFPQQDVSPLLQHMLNKPIDPLALAARIQNAEEGRDLYRLSCIVINADCFMERSYLDGLAQALAIPQQEKEEIERQAKLDRQA